MQKLDKSDQQEYKLIVLIEGLPKKTSRLDKSDSCERLAKYTVIFQFYTSYQFQH